MPRNCRICGDELIDFYYRIDDRSDSFYLCECGAVNPLKRNAAKPLPRYANEWTASGNVTIEEAPPRSSIGGYHTGSSKARAAEKIEVIETEQEVFSI